MQILTQTTSMGKEQKQIEKNRRKAIRNDTKKNFAVIAKSIQSIIQLSRNNAFRIANLRMLQISKENQVEAKVFEQLHTKYT
ncbi:hypothetical protein Bhyg_01575 [Pseudolycoriella hygida]|uniref:Uncharacterized protein n=1 Tax=Pseudolycoriella hygida TaxID=35572 RepID=A0A9Q0N9X1_9DIPT|nr:hypothetical protein Bhyg_01575 [Pseudolycoriella hygida]